MIGVIVTANEAATVEEFFEFFKTPWEFYESGRRYDVVVATTNEIPEVDARLLLVYGSDTKSGDARRGVVEGPRHAGGSLQYQGVMVPIYGETVMFREESRGIPYVAAVSGTMGLRTVSVAGPIEVRLGYDLFQEIQFLLSIGQPVENAHVPTLDLHIKMLKDWILHEGIPLLEIPPAPADHSCAVCLTHDIDFVGIRNHKFDHTMCGFLYRSTIGAVGRLLSGRISVAQLLQIWRAAISLPLVYLGWVKDFWDPFDWYLRVEKGLPATYFFIPFKGRTGERVSISHASRRAAAYDFGDLSQWTSTILNEDCEIGVHGIDAWHSVQKGSDELARIAKVTGESSIGVRMHWLLRDEDTFRVLEEAGYSYDSSVGYNETVGYRSGTTQPFRPFGVKSLMELPVHIQDGALFFPERLDLSESGAWERCEGLLSHVREHGGVLTVIWHDRSHGRSGFGGASTSGSSKN